MKTVCQGHSADLARGLRADGWEIIPAVDAFDDPLAAIEPDTLFLGQGRVAALAYLAGREPRDLVHITEDEEALRAEFMQRGLLPPAQIDDAGTMQ